VIYFFEPGPCPAEIEEGNTVLRSVKELRNYVLAAEDGEIGRCDDFLFDDIHWTIRYMVADTRKWLPGRKVLVSPIALGEANWASQRMEVKLTKQQVKGSPPLDTDAPVSRQYEQKWFQYYGWPYYWTGGGLWGAAPYPSAIYFKRLEKVAEEGVEPEEETHLRSVKEVTDYQILATDGDIGHVEDFIADDDLWLLRYLVVDTKNFLPGGRKVLIPPAWITSVDWVGRSVSVELTVDGVKNSPEYDPTEPINREYEARFYDYHGRPRYW
jgi:hypothetical protein